MNGVEEAGGLRIVRAPSAQPQSQPPHPHPSTSTTHPPSKKFRASPPTSTFPPTRPPAPSKKDQDPEVDEDEDVRTMQSEAEGLRRLSLARGGVLVGAGTDPAFDFSGTGKKKRAAGERVREKPVECDSTEELSMGDTPQMERNKRMRAGHKSHSHPQSDGEGSMDNGTGKLGKGRPSKAAKGQPRKSSTSTRGKRISSLFEGGVICMFFPPSRPSFLSPSLTPSLTPLLQLLESRILTRPPFSPAHPHTSVSDTSLYKHIDCDLPDAARARQLLIWCSSRALSSTPKSPHPPHKPTSNPATNPKDPDKDNTPLPPLTDEQAALLRGVQEDIIRMLAENKIPVQLVSHPERGTGEASTSAGEGSTGKGTGIGLKANEQNVRNRAREVTFGECIAK